MTTPGDGSQLFTPDLAAQYTKVLGAHPIFTTHPNVAAALAQANPDRYTTQVVGGFLQSLETAKQVRMARAGGAKLVLNDQDRAFLQLLGENYSDVDAAPVLKQVDAAQTAASNLSKAAPAQGANMAGAVQVPESHGFFGHVAAALKGAAHLAADVTKAPGVSQVLGGLNTAADATRGAVRISEYGLSKITPGFLDPMDPGAENDRAMRERGYDPSNPISVLAFFSHGGENYNKLDDLRDKYGAGQVRAAQDYLEHPEKFTIGPDFSDADNVARIQALNDPKWQEMLKAVDSRHMSIGRELALGMHLDPNKGPAFDRVSGSLDAVESWFIDPTVVGGKLLKAQKLSKLGIAGYTDEQGIRRMLGDAGNADVKRGWQSLLDNAKIIREGTNPEKAAAYAAIKSATPSLVPLVDEINGKVPHVVGDTMQFTHQAPIETMAGLTDHLVNQNALVRTIRGLTPKTGVYMPGAVSRLGAAKAGAVQAVAGFAATRHEAKIVDLATDAAKVLPTPDDYTTALGEAADRGDALAKMQAGQPLSRGRFLRAARRFTSLVPDETSLDFYSPAATDMVYKWAQVVMPRSEARILAASFSAADLAGRRQIQKSMFEQAIHAGGLESSATGRELAKRMRGDATKAETQTFSMADGADLIEDGAGSRHVAVAPGQVSREMWLPSFRDIQKVAAKVSLYDHTMKRVAESAVVDKIMSSVRLGWMTTTGGAERNILDNLAGATAAGAGWQTVKARLSMSQQAVARRLEREVPAGVAPFTSETAYHKARVGRVINQIRKAKGSVLGHITDDETNAAAELAASEMAQGHLSQLGLNTSSLVTGMADPHNLDQVAEIARMGARPAQIGFGSWEQKGWGPVAADGESGARNWAHNLDQYVSETPGLANHLVSSLRSVDREKWLSGLGGSQREELAQHIAKHPEMAEYRELAELAHGIKTAKTPELKMEAARDVADRMLRSFEPLVTGRDGKLLHNLLDRLDKGEVPSLDWFADHVPTAARPEHVIGREWAPVSANPTREGLLGVGQMVGRAYTDIMAKGYHVVVTGPIAKLSSHPIFVGNVVKARRDLAGYEAKLVEGGLTPESAKLHADKLSLDHALDTTSRMIDNPEVASQMATMSRNMVNFPRAAEDWVRRWSRIVKEDPSVIRKVQMSIQGGQHAGIIDTDSQGNLILTYPGSGATINALLKVGETLHIPGIASIPTVPDLKTNLLYLNPSLNNPFYPGASPLIVTPVKIAQGLFPDSKLMLQDLQTGLTGDDRGASQGIMDQFVPGVVKNMFKALSGDEQNAQLSSAAMNAIVHLEAAGLVPPPNASPDEKDRFLTRVRTAAKNQLVMRAIFAFALPGSPSLPDNATAGDSTKADAIFQAQGITTLDDEARVLISKLGMERATAVWTKLHPDKLMFLVGKTKSNSPYGSVAPTRSAELWIEGHSDFIKEFPSIAAYFVPSAPGDFSPEAYRAQLELGLRTRKGLDQFYTDTRIITAEQTYYAVRDQRDTLIAKAKAAGDTDSVRQAKAVWTAWTQGDGKEPGFLNLNPLFAAKLASYGERTVWREQAVGELENMLTSGKLGTDVSGNKATSALSQPTASPTVDATTAKGVSDFIAGYRAHNSFTDKMRGKRDADSVAAKDIEQHNYDKFMLGVTGAAYDDTGRLVGGNPALRDLYQGLFRGLN